MSTKNNNKQTQQNKDRATFIYNPLCCCYSLPDEKQRTLKCVWWTQAMREVVVGWVGWTNLLPSSMKSLRLRVFLRAADGVKPLGEKSRNVRLGFRPSAAPLLVAVEVPVPPGASCCQPGGTSETSPSAAAAAAPAAWLSPAVGRALPQQTKLAARLSQPNVNSPRAREWNMATGSCTGQHQASFSTACLPVTWFNIERLFYSNWPRQLFLLAVKCSPALVSRRLMFFFVWFLFVCVFFPFTGL